MSTQTTLFGDDEPQPTTETTVVAGAPSNDLALVADVIQAATDPGYLLQNRPGETLVLRRVPARGDVAEPAGDKESRVVEQLLASGLLRRGGTHQVRAGLRGQLSAATSVLVPEAARSMLRRWTALHSIPRLRATPAD